MARLPETTSIRARSQALQPGEQFTIENTRSPQSVISMVYIAHPANNREKSFKFVKERSELGLYNVTVLRVR